MRNRPLFFFLALFSLSTVNAQSDSLNFKKHQFGINLAPVGIVALGGTLDRSILQATYKYNLKSGNAIRFDFVGFADSPGFYSENAETIVNDSVSIRHFQSNTDFLGTLAIGYEHRFNSEKAVSWFLAGSVYGGWVDNSWSTTNDSLLSFFDPTQARSDEFRYVWYDERGNAEGSKGFTTEYERLTGYNLGARLTGGIEWRFAERWSTEISTMIGVTYVNGKNRVSESSNFNSPSDISVQDVSYTTVDFPAIVSTVSLHYRL